MEELAATSCRADRLAASFLPFLVEASSRVDSGCWASRENVERPVRKNCAPDSLRSDRIAFESEHLRS